jgi:hypothetical protein
VPRATLGVNLSNSRRGIWSERAATDKAAEHSKRLHPGFHDQSIPPLHAAELIVAFTFTSMLSPVPIDYFDWARRPHATSYIVSSCVGIGDAAMPRLSAILKPLCTTSQAELQPTLPRERDRSISRLI